jgi:two-component system CheB/CheR fusion protein
VSFPIVGVGASAGGLEAFRELLTQLPLDSGMGFVFIQHLDPQHESALTDLLQRATKLPVQEVTNNLRVEPNHVYVIPPNRNMGITAGALTLRPRPPGRTPARSIDAFFEALAEDQRERAIGVVLSGTASDGTIGLEAIKAEGGITFAQDDSARYDSMPRSAVAAGCVDFVLSPEQIAGELARIARHPAIASGPDALATPEDNAAFATAHEDDDTALPSGGHGTPATEAEKARAEARRPRRGSAGAPGTDGFKKILLLLRNHAGVDFSLYKSNTIQRRIVRRMILSKRNTLQEYARFLRGNAKELDALYADVLISVTSFFRNPDSFEVLRRKVWPDLLKQRSDEPIRIWVLGCSTGQEAYSLAMGFAEAADKAPRMRALQIFATDLNDALLDKARHGLYAKSVAEDVSPERLRRFFVEEEGGYRVSKALREKVVFARQNVISDPPFSRMDLISCRNLLIYFEPDLQRRVLPVFHYALKPGGFLYLGASESVGGFTDLFEVVDKKHKIYSKKPAQTPAFQLAAQKEAGKPPGERAMAARTPADRSHAEDMAGGFHGEVTAQREADRIAVNQFAPPAVLVNAELQVLQFRGPTGAYLEPPKGKASFDVLKMARPGLMLPLRAAINRARKDRKTARREGVTIEQNGTSRTINLEVIPLNNLRERCFLIVFESPRTPMVAKQPGIAKGRGRSGADARRVMELETELAETRDYLQSIQEQHEAANEELQASNEEVQSANEELQSVNEELETSKEELESANEELTTVNDEMASRNTELHRLNSDLVNIQTSAHQAIVLLGRDLTIRRFSAQAGKQFNLLAGDVGRPLNNVRHNLDLPELDGVIREVIDAVRATEREVRDREGHWFSLRVRPYLALDNKVDGAVLVLVDIDTLKRSEHATALARDYAEKIIETVREPLLVLDAGLRVERANRAFYRTFGVMPAETAGKLVYDLGNRQWDIAELRTLLEDVLASNNAIDDFSVTHDFEAMGRRTMLLNARRVHNPEREAERILLAIEDITERRQAEQDVRDSAEKYRQLVEGATGFALIMLDPDGRIMSWNIGAQRLLGYSDAAILGQDFSRLFRPEDQAMGLPQRELETAARGEIGPDDNWLRREDGSLFWASGATTALRDDKTHALTGFTKVVRDLTERKLAEEASSEASRHKDEFLAMLAHELRNPLAPIRTGLELIRVAGNTPDAVDRVRSMMQRQVDHMVKLVDDLLDASRISRGRIELRRQPLLLSAVVQQAVEVSRPLCDSRDHRLTVMLPPDPIYLDADPTRLAQIIGNLLNNACKFTDRGGSISLAVDRESASDLVIRVRDTGVGISAHDLPRVFELFTQMDTSLERSRTGLGIGLTLVRTLAQLHGGDVAVSSPGAGQGSEFVVRLPVVMDTPDEAQPPATSDTAEGIRPLRILVADDNEDSVESLVDLLRLRGHDMHVAHDGFEAVAAAARVQPDVILLDIGMPGLNGYDVARTIRAQQRDKPPILVALTGWGQEEYLRRSTEAGFDAHIVKPVKDDVLLRAIRQLLGRS